jgi:hypothetical protein
MSTATQFALRKFFQSKLLLQASVIPSEIPPLEVHFNKLSGAHFRIILWSINMPEELGVIQ